MKKPHFLSIATLMLATGLTGFGPKQAAAEKYLVDPDHSAVVFRVKHLGIATVFGRFHQPSGWFVYDMGTPDKNDIGVQVAAENVDTGVEKRDNHLRSLDFFNVEEYPLILFKSRSVKAVGQHRFEMTGDITLLGNTRTVTVQVEQTGAGSDPRGKCRRGFETSFSILRQDYGMNFMPDVVGSKVDLTISVEGTRG